MDSISMKLWLLQREEAPIIDEYLSFVIAAPTEKEAREIANGECGGEGYVWTDGSKTSCLLLSPQVEEGFDGIIAKVKE